MNNDYIYHYGIKGQKWGVRRYQNDDGSLTAAGKKREKMGYRSTGIRAAMARRSNEKVDSGFKKWKKNDNKKQDAIDLGKKANAARIAYEKDRKNKDLKKAYKTANRDYKRALRKNTTYRKGVVRQEVGRDASRKYLSEAKKVEKQLKNDPKNRALRKEYNRLMSTHDVERAQARRAVDVATKRSRRIAEAKRQTTLALKGAAAAVIIGVGTKYVADRTGIDISSEQVQDWIKKGRKAYQFIY